MRKIPIAVALVLLVAASQGPSVAGDIVNETAKLTASDGDVLDQFGIWCAIDGDTLVVGAPDDDSAASVAGSAYVFQQSVDGDNLTWQQVVKLIASDVRPDQGLGGSVDISGDVIVAGARSSDEDVGAAYVWERNAGGAGNWGEVAILAPTDRFDRRFGEDVAIHGDRMVVTASSSSIGTNRGAAYVYGRDPVDGSWDLIVRLAAGPDDHDQWGERAALDGGTLVVAAPFRSDAGAVYVYERDLGGADAWGLDRILAPDELLRFDFFGISVDLDGDTLIVGALGDDSIASGAGAAYILERDRGGPGNWGVTTKLVVDEGGVFDRELNGFGWSTAIENDIAIVSGASFADPNGTGQAYRFARNEGGPDAWGRVAELQSPDVDIGDEYGRAVALSGDTAIVSASRDDDVAMDAGALYVFDVIPNCGNGTVEGDEECDDGNLLEGDGCSSTCTLECRDGDGDGFGTPGDPSCSAGADDDCDDTNPAVNPDAGEVCDNGLDDDCDGLVDDADFADCDALVVRLIGFHATALPSGQVLLQWETALEIDNVGFRVWRTGDRRKAEELQLVAPLIPAMGSEVQGATYTHVDRPGKSGTLTYYLESVDLFGVVERFRPITVEVGPSRTRQGQRAPA